MAALTPAALSGSVGPAVAVRKTSVAGSTISGVSGTRRNIAAEFDFNLGAAKTKVLKAVEESVPAAFVHVYQGQLFDRLLHGLILYLCALFQHEALVRCMERSRQQHLEGYNPYLVAARLKELEDEAASQRMALSQPYCEVIMKHSSYKKPQKDRRFFEALYSSMAAVLDEAFERVGKQQAIHQELDRLFRGRHFNIAARVNRPQRSVDSLTVTQIWSLKNETDNRSLHAKLISGLYEKPAALGVQVASQSNTPLVSQAVSSPMVARGLLADKAERDALAAAQSSRAPSTAPQTGRSVGAVKAAMAAHGMDLSAVATPAALKQLQPTAGTLNAAGILTRQDDSTIAAAAAAAAAAAQAPGVSGSSPRQPAVGSGTGSVVGASPGPRSSTLKPFQSTVASLPEAAGLPYDESYAYLCLLRRYVIYGPQLGLATAPPVAGRSMASMTGAALAGAGFQDMMLGSSMSGML
uniref:Uncharacterized protein n=1 Tax=Tetradesmus obliquus TaxID=3088 RepID=A0A383W4U4_TETOB|eukprot:jgi/Sobl393_1/10113/SZX79449.1